MTGRVALLWREFRGVRAGWLAQRSSGAHEPSVFERAALYHPRDITAEDLKRALAVSEEPELLAKLVNISRAAFGFYVGQFTYTINYPWVATQLQHLPPGSRVLDVGAGLNPIPLWLAQRGMMVESVDSHPIVRLLPPTGDWNEWGFFDYRQLDPKVKSHHCTIIEFTPADHFDAIYAVCVLAHMPRATWKETLRRCREWLRPGGKLVLTIDLIPASDFVWNFSEGVEVEPLLVHGTVREVLHHLASSGFQVNQARTLRTLYNSRTDLLLIDCTA